MYACALCGARECVKGMQRPPRDCPGLDPLVQASAAEYARGELEGRFARVSGAIAPDHTRSRLEQTMAFARECGFTHLGLAFCIALSREAAIVARVLVGNGFTVDSVICKVGGLSREAVGLRDTGRAMCNPIAQAQFLAARGTQLNIMMGLCVGHDTIFLRHTRAPVTVLAVKDWKYDHNPVAGIREQARGEDARD